VSNWRPTYLRHISLASDIFILRQNKCKGGGGRRRALQENSGHRRLLEEHPQEMRQRALQDISSYYWRWNANRFQVNAAVKWSVYSSEQIRSAATQVESFARMAEIQAKPEVAALMSEKAMLMNEKALLLTEKAQLLAEREYMMGQREGLLENIAADNAVEESLKETEATVVDLKSQLQEKEKTEAELEQTAADKAIFEKQVRLYQQEWDYAIEMLGIVNDEIKAVGKMEDDLNKAVRWFSKNYGCELGVVVERLE